MLDDEKYWIIVELTASSKPRENPKNHPKRGEILKMKQLSVVFALTVLTQVVNFTAPVDHHRQSLLARFQLQGQELGVMA